jgi:TolB-like protein/AraC-like DNA-binding protein/tetratricopeptide (TPR) repeat protein
MADTGAMIDKEFVNQVIEILEKNISNEQFGVSELADAVNMSRSNLLRKVKKDTNLSVSQLINQVRLNRAMELLRTTSHNVSEVGHQVGFSSTSYFIKCFREHYGYPPGEVGKGEPVSLTSSSSFETSESSRKRNFKFMVLAAGLVVVSGVVAFLVFYQSVGKEKPSLEKSIVVLPFKNESNDSSNVYLINGLMESTLTNLQKIKELRVLSRTSAEKYRDDKRSVPEMSRELNANYFIEGSGQKIGDEILLNIQLIEGPTDKHLWAKQYRRQAKDIFALQQEIAKNITAEIQVIMTPDEKSRIEKIPTNDLEAYDLYMKGMAYLPKPGERNQLTAIGYFTKATQRDPEFALAYAQAVMAYYYLDIFKSEKRYLNQIDSLSDKALLYDPKLPESLIAKAVYYLQKKEYEQALPYMEKSLVYNPNSSLTIAFLTDFYANHLPNTARYLEYALKGLRLGVDTRDSVKTSYMYLRLSNALMQAGFFEQALHYIDKSNTYYPENPYSYIKVFILLAKDRDCDKAKARLLPYYQKDTTRLDILQELGKLEYLTRNYDDAYTYYKKFLSLRDAYKLDIYKHEFIRIAYVMEQVGEKKRAKDFLKEFKDFADHDRTLYKNLYLSGYYSYVGNNQKALEHLKLFSNEDDFLFWVLIFDQDPMLDGLMKLPESKASLRKITDNFWSQHEKVKAILEEEGLM